MLKLHFLHRKIANSPHLLSNLDKNDIRSSNYLEDAATEIQVQGLELDYTCVLWDADLRCENGRWRYYNFNGRTEWREEAGKTESSLERRKYMLNVRKIGS